MSFQLTRFQLPCGTSAARIAWQATIIGGDDAAELLRRAQPGGDLHRLPLLILTEQASGLSPEARRLSQLARRPGGAGGRGDQRADAGCDQLHLRITQDQRVRLFTEEPQAIHWLDTRARAAPES
ncbi:MAG TPA: hypothetical protein VIG99_09945 [Myxococcaceae bacterium]|jgi:hypothetical protein